MGSEEEESAMPVGCVGGDRKGYTLCVWGWGEEGLLVRRGHEGGERCGGGVGQVW